MPYLIAGLIIAGYSIRLIAIIEMSGNFTSMIKKPSRLVKTGIYKYVRNPAYLGSLLAIFGMSCWNPLCLPITYVAFMFFTDRIDREEEMLEATFGIEYLEYKKNTKMLIPFLL